MGRRNEKIRLRPIYIFKGCPSRNKLNIGLVWSDDSLVGESASEFPAERSLAHGKVCLFFFCGADVKQSSGEVPPSTGEACVMGIPESCNHLYKSICW